MNLKFIFFSGVVATVVGYAIYDYSTVDQKNQEKKEKDRIVGYKIEDVKKITVLKTGSNPIAITQGSGRWKIETPIVEEANQSETNSYVNDLLLERQIAVVKEGADLDLEIYGLKTPQGQVTFETQNAKMTVLVGKKNLRGEPFVMVEGSNRVLTGTNMWAIKIEQKLNEFRDRRLWKKSFDSISEVLISGPEGDVSLKKEAAKWIFSKPELQKFSVDTSRVQELITQLQAVEGIDIVAEGDKALKASTSGVVIRFPEDEISFIANKKGEKFAQVKSLKRVFKIADSDFSKFQNYSIGSFRNKREAFQFSSEKTFKVKIKNDSNINSFEKNDSKNWIWKESSSEYQFNPGKLDALVKSLSSYEAFDFYKGEVKKPTVEVEIEAEGSKPIVFKIYPEITFSKQNEKLMVNPIISSLSESIVLLKSEEIKSLGLSEVVQKKALK